MSSLLREQTVEYGSTVQLMSLDAFNGGGLFTAYWYYLDGENKVRVEATQLENVIQDITLYLYSETPEEDYVSITYVDNEGENEQQVEYASTGLDPNSAYDLYSAYTIKGIKFTDDDDNWYYFKRSGYQLKSWKNQDPLEGYQDEYKEGDKPYVGKDPKDIRSLTLLAQWEPIKYRVKFNANRPSGAPEVEGTMSNQTITYDVETPLSGNEFSIKGYTFTGWNTDPDGGGDSYSNGQTVKNLTDENETVTLYAQWKRCKYNVYFFGNGTETMDQLPTSLKEMSADCYTYVNSIAYNGTVYAANNFFVRDGYTFAGWNTVANPTEQNPGSLYNESDEITVTENLMLFAQWEKTVTTYTFKFNANGGEGTMADQTITLDGESSNVLNANAFTREGYEFIGWNTVAEPTEENPGNVYLDGEKISEIDVSADNTITLYAQWQKEEAAEDASIIGVTGSFNDKIKLNYYLEFSDALLADTEAKVLLTSSAGKELELLVREAEYVPGRGYKFSIPLAAKEASDTITAKVIDGSGKPVTIKGKKQEYPDGVPYTLVRYLDWLEENGKDADERAVGAAAKDYCSAAQIYFDYNAEGVAVSNAVDAVTQETVSPYIAVRSGTLPAGVSIKGITVMLESDNALRLYLTFKGAQASDFIYKIDEETVDIKQRSDGAYYLALDSGVYSNHLQDSHNYSISDGTNTYMITASVLTYARACVKKTVEAESNLGKSLYLYNQAAVACFGDDD